MFVELLEYQEKDALMMLLVNIAKIDGSLNDSEMDFLEKYANEHELKLDLETSISIVDTCRQISSIKAKVVTIQEIIKLAIVDGNYDDAEKAGAMVISEILGIKNDKFEEIEEWVLDGQKWVQKGFQLLG